MALTICASLALLVLLALMPPQLALSPPTLFALHVPRVPLVFSKPFVVNFLPPCLLTLKHKTVFALLANWPLPVLLMNTPLLAQLPLILPVLPALFVLAQNIRPRTAELVVSLLLIEFALPAPQPVLLTPTSAQNAKLVVSLLLMQFAHLALPVQVPLPTRVANMKLVLARHWAM